MNPGFANLLGMVSAGVCDRIDSIRMLESVDSTGYDSPDTERSVGYGLPVDDPSMEETPRRLVAALDRVDDLARRFRAAGDRFELSFEEPHAERYGPQGATYWAARRHSAA